MESLLNTAHRASQSLRTMWSHIPKNWKITILTALLNLSFSGAIARSWATASLVFPPDAMVHEGFLVLAMVLFTVGFAAVYRGLIAHEVFAKPSGLKYAKAGCHLLLIVVSSMIIYQLTFNQVV